MGLFATTLPRSDRPTGTRDWLSPAFVSPYLAAADSGSLRQRGSSALPSPDATRRIRRACLRLLAEAAGVDDPVEDAVTLPGRRPRVDQEAAALAVSHWRWRALPPHARPGEIRTAAMAVLVHEAGMRSGELAALVPEDLDLDAGTVSFQPRPPSARVLPPPREVPLSDAAVTLLRRWLEVRADLVEKTPRTRTLWVSLAANHDGFGVRRPAGMPLQPTGLRRAHARAVAALNVHLATRPDREPLPLSVGQFRGARD